jgi:hypothetical protein
VSDGASNYEGFHIDDVEVRSVQDTTTAVSNLSTAPSVLTYPNPAQNTIQIALAGMSFTGNISVNVYDQMGRKILRFTMDKPTVTLNTQDLPTGIYYLKATGDNISLPVHKITICR